MCIFNTNASLVIPCKGSNIIKARGSRSAEIIWPPFMLLVATICLPFSSLNCTCRAIKYRINLKAKKKLKIQFAFRKAAKEFSKAG